MTDQLTKAVRKGWAEEIKRDLLDELGEEPHVQQWTNIINEGWLSAGTTEFIYKVGVNEDSLWAEVWKSDEDYETERPSIAAFEIELRIKPVTV